MYEHLYGYCQLCKDDEARTSWQLPASLNEPGIILRLCRKCFEFVDENHGVTGKVVVKRCKGCGHVSSVDFKKYKKRGRPEGAKTSPEKKGERKRERLGLKRITEFTGA